MASAARRKVAGMLVEALKKEGLRVNSMRPEASVADAIWCAEGGATKLDVARWGLDCTCENTDGALQPVHVSSWLTLTAASKEKSLPLVRHGLRQFEV